MSRIYMSGLLESLQDACLMKFLSYSKMKEWTIRVDDSPREDAPKDLLSWCTFERGAFLERRYTATIDGYSADTILEIILCQNPGVEVYWDWRKQDYIVKTSRKNLNLGSMRALCKIVKIKEEFNIVGSTQGTEDLCIAKLEEIA